MMAETWLPYSNLEIGLALSHPAKWTTQVLSPTQFVVTAPAERDGYRPMLSYTRVVPDGTDEAWFAETIRYSEEQQRMAYSDYKLLRSERLTLAGVRAFWRHCEWRYEDSKIFSVNLQVMLWPGPETLFILKAATLKTLAARDVPLFEKIILSTQLKP